MVRPDETRRDSSDRLDSEPLSPPSVRGEMPPRERGWPLAAWLVIAALALAVSLVALDAALSWF